MMFWSNRMMSRKKYDAAGSAAFFATISTIIFAVIFAIFAVGSDDTVVAVAFATIFPVIIGFGAACVASNDDKTPYKVASGCFYLTMLIVVFAMYA